MSVKEKSAKRGKGRKKKETNGEEQEADIKEMAMANSRIWEMKLTAAEKSNTTYREYARSMAMENTSLRTQVEQTERDTLDVVTYLKQVDEEKDYKIDYLSKQLGTINSEYEREQEKMRCVYESKVQDLESELRNRTEEVSLLKSELRLVKEFRLQRERMRNELEEIKEAMREMEREHKETMVKMENKFLEDKVKVQNVADAKISQLAARAQSEAIANLDKTTKLVYKENVRLAEALALHTTECERLRVAWEHKEKENKELKSAKELSEQLIEQKVSESQKLKKTIKELEEKVSTLETSLGHSVREFNNEQMALVARSGEESALIRKKCDTLERALVLKNRELARMKKASRSVLGQRSEVERFLIDALDYVKKEISASRLQYRKDAEAVYRQHMYKAHAGKGEYPRVRTFSRTGSSTNSVYRDLEAAEQQLFEEAEVIDISEMTWEQKEKVLRHLFMQISSQHVNQQQATSTQPTAVKGAALQAAYESALEQLHKDHLLLDGEDEALNPAIDPAFLTEAIVDDSRNFERLPKINA